MLGIDIFLIYGLQIWKGGIKSKKKSRKYKKGRFFGIKPKSTPTIIERESNPSPLQ